MEGQDGKRQMFHEKCGKITWEKGQNVNWVRNISYNFVLLKNGADCVARAANG